MVSVCHYTRAEGRLNQNEKQTALSKLEVMMAVGNERFGGGCQIFFEPLSTYELCFPLIYHPTALGIRMTKTFSSIFCDLPCPAQLTLVALQAVTVSSCMSPERNDN